MSLDIKRMVSETQYGGGSSIVYPSAIKEGEDFDFRILPPAKDMENCVYVAGKSFYYKFSDGPKGYIGSKMWENFSDTLSPFEEQMKRLSPAQKATLDDLKKQTKIKIRMLYYIPIIQIQRSKNSPEGYVIEPQNSIKILAATVTIQKDIVNCILNYSRHNESADNGICDVKEGTNLTLKATGSGLQKRYRVDPWPSKSKLLNDDGSPAVEGVPNLDFSFKPLVLEAFKREALKQEYIDNFLERLNFLAGVEAEPAGSGNTGSTGVSNEPARQKQDEDLPF